MLNPHICNDYASKDTFEFVTEINNQSISNRSFLVSYDVKSLFTCIPLKETIEIAVDVIINNTQNLKVSKVELKKLFEYATSKSHFLFNGTFYDQIDGVSMGSPLAPTLANLFLGHHEGKWLKDYTNIGPQFYKRYVDDIIAVFNNEYEARDFLTYLNSKHKNIEFTIECENDKTLNFLDVTLDTSGGKLSTRIYRKPTFTGLLMNYFSFTPMTYKIGLVRCLIDRIYKINNSWAGYDCDLNKLFSILKRNLYPRNLCNKIAHNYLELKRNIDNSDKNPVDKPPDKIKHFLNCYM